MQKLRIDVTKIPKERIFVGKKGKYLDLVLHENRNGEDEWGNAGFVAVDVSKEEREAGTKGPIVGNWKHLGGKSKEAATPPQKSAPRPPADPDLGADDGDEIPF